ncbi:MAG TPA: NUDIX domain-containing protein [Gammaproteobacteria bacterium]|nr:NUDIX domain-containing protein [Gammaproteobacteria bacterium]
MVEKNVRGAVRFNQPAGHLEDDGSLIDAAVRECLEETAWQFQPETLVGIYRWRNTAKNDTFLRATFCGTCTDEDKQRPLDTGILATHWLTLEEIRSRSDLLRSPMFNELPCRKLAGYRRRSGLARESRFSEIRTIRGQARSYRFRRKRRGIEAKGD